MFRFMAHPIRILNLGYSKRSIRVVNALLDVLSLLNIQFILPIQFERSIFLPSVTGRVSGGESALMP